MPKDPGKFINYVVTEIKIIIKYELYVNLKLHHYCKRVFIF